MRKRVETTEGTRRRLPFAFALAVAMLAFSPAPARAAFIGAYSADHFTLINNNADGYVIAPEGGLNLLLTGGNNGSGKPGQTDFVIPAVASGTVRFQWLYGSTDIPGVDMAGYLVGNVFTKLSDTAGDGGSVEFAVVANQSFGFRVATSDNTFGAGMLQVTAFEAPDSVADIASPEPGTMFCAALALALLHLTRRRAA